VRGGGSLGKLGRGAVWGGGGARRGDCAGKVWVMLRVLGWGRVWVSRNVVPATVSV
jgi:hypothetical protein